MRTRSFPFLRHFAGWLLSGALLWASPCLAVCGDGIVDPGEECDGSGTEFRCVAPFGTAKCHADCKCNAPLRCLHFRVRSNVRRVSKSPLT